MKTFPRYSIVLVLIIVLLISAFLVSFTLQKYYPSVFISGETSLVNAGLLRLDHENRRATTLISRATGVRVARFDFFYSPLKTSDSLTVYVVDNKKGYFNLYSYTRQIPAKFDLAWQFDNESGLAAVIENNKLGFINTKGIYVIPPHFPYHLNKYQGSSFIFHEGFCLIPSGNSGLFGLINTSGDVVVDPVYQMIEKTEKGWLILKQDQYGFLDSAFKMVLSPIYDKIMVIAEGIVVSRGTTQQLLDFDYKTVLISGLFNYVYKLYSGDDTDTEHSDPSSTKLEESGFSIYRINGKCGLIDDASGKVLSPPYYDDIFYYSPGVFRATLSDFSILIDRHGNQIKTAGKE